MFYQVLYHQNGNPGMNMISFMQLEFLLLPFEKLTALCIENLSKRYNEIYSSTKTKNTIYIGVVLALVIFGFLLVLWRLFKITKSFISLMEIFTQFSEVDLKKIIKYCFFLQQMFSHLTKKYDQFQDTERAIVSKSR